VTSGDFSEQNNAIQLPIHPSYELAVSQS